MDNQQILDLGYAILFATIFAAAAIFCCITDLRHRKPQGLRKLLALIGYISAAIIMSIAIISAALNQMFISIIAFTGLILLLIITSIIYKFTK